MQELKKKDIVYYARIIPSSGIYDVYELIVRTVEDDWFVGLEKRDKQAFLFSSSDFNKTVFKNRNKALEVVKFAESNKKELAKNEVFYEEY